MLTYIIRTNRHAFTINHDLTLRTLLYPILIGGHQVGINWELEEIKALELVTENVYQEFSSVVVNDFNRKIKTIVRGEM
jgi:hypothetical protein